MYIVVLLCTYWLYYVHSGFIVYTVVLLCTQWFYCVHSGFIVYTVVLLCTLYIVFCVCTYSVFSPHYFSLSPKPLDCLCCHSIMFVHNKLCHFLYLTLYRQSTGSNLWHLYYRTETLCTGCHWIRFKEDV